MLMIYLPLPQTMAASRKTAPTWTSYPDFVCMCVITYWWQCAHICVFIFILVSGSCVVRSGRNRWGGSVFIRRHHCPEMYVCSACIRSAYSYWHGAFIDSLVSVTDGIAAGIRCTAGARQREEIIINTAKHHNCMYYVGARYERRFPTSSDIWTVVRFCANRYSQYISLLLFSCSCYVFEDSNRRA